MSAYDWLMLGILSYIVVCIIIMALLIRHWQRHPPHPVKIRRVK